MKKTGRERKAKLPTQLEQLEKVAKRLETKPDILIYNAFPSGKLAYYQW